MPAFALGGAAATMVGHNLGALKSKRARKAAWWATGIDVVFMMFIGIISFLFAPLIIGIFNKETDVIQIGSDYLRIVPLSYVFTALGVVLGRALQGAGDTLATMVITVFSLWGLQIPLAFFFSKIWGTNGIWWSIVLTTVVNGIITVIWFERGEWKKKKGHFLSKNGFLPLTLKGIPSA